MKALKSLLLLFFMGFCPAGNGFAQDVKFIMPLKGVEGKDYFIADYMDHDSTKHVSDAFCGSQTYNGHQGTDFCLRSFKTMDSGVYVYAVAAGRVSKVIDGKYDRNKNWNRKGAGNFIIITHTKEMSTKYQHLMSHSMMVKPGDTVQAGQAIARVGSSGKSMCPHLHL
jgi:murein DD-endopeptidase MepM/ murein hydrolase activator NlpD